MVKPKLKIHNTGKFQALLLMPIGFLCAFFYSFGGLIYDLIYAGGFNSGTLMAFLSLLGMPLIFAVGGYCLGCLEAAIYNLVTARFTKGEISVYE